MNNIYLQLSDLKSEISNLALATVTTTKGSTPQKPGSSAIFSEKGLVSGTVGGGVVEGRVERLAMEAVRSKKSGHFVFNLANDISYKEEAICGGQIYVLIDAHLKNHVRLFERLKKAYDNHIPGVLITMVTPFSEDEVMINRYWATEKKVPAIPDPFLKDIEPVIHDMIKQRNPMDYREMELSIPGEEPSSLFFMEAVFPPAVLVIAGAGHIGKALSHLAHNLNFEITVVDDRCELANSENIPDADHFIVSDIGVAFSKLVKNENTYVVIVTSGHKYDAAALRPCIGAGLAYTGMIGSRNKIAAMRQSFIENQLATEEEWAEIFTPIGLDIKSRTVEEIALSIAAQLVLVRNSRNV